MFRWMGDLQKKYHLKNISLALETQVEAVIMMVNTKNFLAG
jgi:hypothetical protein